MNSRLQTLGFMTWLAISAGFIGTAHGEQKPSASRCVVPTAEEVLGINHDDLPVGFDGVVSKRSQVDGQRFQWFAINIGGPPMGAMYVLDCLGRPLANIDLGYVESATEINSGIALVAAIAPSDELEAAMAVQMAGVHSLACELLGRAKQTDRADHITLYGGMAVKLTRTFAAQVEALAKLRGGGKQQVEVRHVYVNGNAVIGDIHGGGGVNAQNEHQPLAPGLAFAPGATVPSALEAERETVQGASGDGADGLPDARRR